MAGRIISAEEMAALEGQSPAVTEAVTKRTVSAEEMAGMEQEEQSKQTLRNFGSGAVSAAGRVITEDVPAVAKAALEFWRSSPRWAGGGSDDIIPTSQAALAKRMVMAEADRVTGKVGSAMNALERSGDPMGDPDTLMHAAGALPLVGPMIEEPMRAVASGDPRQLGEATVNTAVNLAPVERLAVPAKALARMPSVKRVAQNFTSAERRVKNAAQATGAAPIDVPFLERRIDDITESMPVGGRKRLERLSREERARTGEALGEAEEGLADARDIDVEDILEEMDPKTHPLMREEPEGQRIIEVAEDPDLARAVEKEQKILQEMAGHERTLPASTVAKTKRGRQAAANRARAYDQTPGGAAVSAKAVAQSESAAALKSSIEKIAKEGDTAAQKYLGASDESSLAIGLDEPMAARRNAMLAAGGGAHGAELMGRAGAGARGMGGQAAAGALVGMQAVKVWNSPLWNSLSLRMKKHLLSLLEGGGFDVFREGLASAVALESSRRVQAERETRTQGEGVVEP